MKIVNDSFDDLIQDYDRVLDGISKCVSAYRRRCDELISIISQSISVEQCRQSFDELQEIQGRLAKLLFVREIDIGEQLSSLTRAFDRLDDDQTRGYWFERFKKGVTWPVE